MSCCICIWILHNAKMFHFLRLFFFLLILSWNVWTCFDLWCIKRKLSHNITWSPAIIADMTIYFCMFGENNLFPTHCWVLGMVELSMHLPSTPLSFIFCFINLFFSSYFECCFQAVGMYSCRYNRSECLHLHWVAVNGGILLAATWGHSRKEWSADKRQVQKSRPSDGPSSTHKPQADGTAGVGWTKATL